MYNSPLTSNRQRKNNDRLLHLEQNYELVNRRHSKNGRRINDQTSLGWLILESLSLVVLATIVGLVLFVALLF